MIPVLPGWTKRVTDDSIELCSERGAGAGLIRYRERLQPVATMDAIIADLLARCPEVTDREVGSIDRFATDEGEHAAAVTVRGTLRGRPIQGDLGAVFTDDFYQVVSGASLQPPRFGELSSAVRELTRRDSLGLGRRRRRARVAVPVGWRRRDRGLVIELTPPGFAAAPALVTVYPAEPLPVDPAHVHAAWLAQAAAAGLTLATHGATTDAQAQSWSATGTNARGRASSLELAVRVDAGYLYALAFESAAAGVTLAGHRAAWRDIVSSLQPVPARASAAEATALFNWCV